MKMIVIYYSWASHTKRMAEIIAAQTGAEVHEIVPVTPYPKNYNAIVDQAKKEIRSGYLPEINNIEFDLSDYDVVFVGTPNWWSTMAPPLASWLKMNALDGKIVMPFISHGGGGKGHADNDISKLCPNSKVMDMYEAYEGGGSSAQNEISEWINRNIKVMA